MNVAELFHTLELDHDFLPSSTLELFLHCPGYGIKPSSHDLRRVRLEASVCEETGDELRVRDKGRIEVRLGRLLGWTSYISELGTMK